jgi:hypothetical protein
MTVAYVYPLLGVFWSLMILFLFIAFALAVFRVFADLFRSDMGGFAKAIWVIAIIWLPVIGVLAYLIAHGDKMAGRSATVYDEDYAYQSGAAYQNAEMRSWV